MKAEIKADAYIHITAESVLEVFAIRQICAMANERDILTRMGMPTIESFPVKIDLSIINAKDK